MTRINSHGITVEQFTAYVMGDIGVGSLPEWKKVKKCIVKANKRNGTDYLWRYRDFSICNIALDKLNSLGSDELTKDRITEEFIKFDQKTLLDIVAHLQSQREFVERKGKMLRFDWRLCHELKEQAGKTKGMTFKAALKGLLSLKHQNFRTRYNTYRKLHWRWVQGNLDKTTT